MNFKKCLTVVLAAILVVSFLFGALAPMSRANNPFRPRVIKCVTELGTSIDIEQTSGSYACDAERCFYYDACIEDNLIYECCYRYNKGLCDCMCQVLVICD